MGLGDGEVWGGAGVRSRVNAEAVRLHPHIRLLGLICWVDSGASNLTCGMRRRNEFVGRGQSLTWKTCRLTLVGCPGAGAKPASPVGVREHVLLEPGVSRSGLVFQSLPY